MVITLSSIGLALGSFFGIYLLSTTKWKSLPNTILGLLLLFLSIRTGKAIFYNFLELPLFVKNLGLAANLAVGPLLYLYGKALLYENFKPHKSLVWHFFPAILYVFFCWLIPNSTEDLFWYVSYSLILLQSYIYIFLGLKTWYAQRELNIRSISNWYKNLTLSLLIMWSIYGLIFIKVLPYHIAGAISFSVLIFILAFTGFDQEIVFSKNTFKKYQNSNLSEEEVKKYHATIVNVIKNNRLYLEPNLTIQRLSELTGIHVKIISETVNRCEQTNFPGFVNSFRIKEAKKLLKDTKTNYKIAAVAYNSGFNSLSVFNRVFKDITSFTPSEYRSLI
ncbi:AraC family transcriptional regulator [Allomuricauda sp. d1]|uniref:helix-turn-helix domain-containing protein n=1 Tax=Allomuricauda sp. d1 TaxID=3136725 RepID=UPI0031D19262